MKASRVPTGIDGAPETPPRVCDHTAEHSRDFIGTAIYPLPTLK